VAFITAGIILQLNTERIISKSRSASSEAIESFHLHNKLQNIVKNVILTESRVRGFVITGDSNYIAGVQDTLNLLQQELEGLQKASMNQYNQASFTTLASLIEKRILTNNEIIEVYTRFGKAQAEKRISSKAGSILRDSITDLSMQLEKDLYTQLQAGIAQNRKRTLYVLTISRLLTILGLLGIVILSMLVIRHILQQAKLIQELEQANQNETEARQQAFESANVKEQFLANMSHEIRTPINSVIGFTNLLQKTTMMEEQKQFVNLIQSASENLLTIINDILDISKIEAGMLRIESNPFSLRGLCSSIETMFYHKAREKNLSFSLHFQDNIPDTLTGDAVRLTQILVNLISNAIKFTQKGGISINITTLAQNDKEVRVRFSVKDSGIGIPADQLEPIFERFQQGETDTTRKYGGTGLGLSIVRNLVQLQGGNITVESEQGKGTEFIFDIAYSLVPMTETLPIAPGEKTTITAGAFPHAHILVVEDNSMNQLLIKFTFESWKMSYQLADNGAAAIEWLQRASFNLVLLDIQMPLMDGYATAQAIRKELKSDIPIIAMTAHALAGEREKCLSYGMNDYISKPIHEKELFSLLKKYLDDNRDSNLESLRNELHYIDLNFLEDMVMGNGEFLKTIIKQFLKQFPGEMEALKNAIDQKDPKRVATLAHHIQSTVSILGKNTPFFQQLEKLEKLANKQPVPATLSTEFDKLHDYKHLLLQEVNQLLNANVF
jgi:signal transduction histidine kinase/FixJ family two-component response regulator